MFRSSRHRRIDRALSAVLDKIEADADDRRSRCRTWRESYLLGMRTGKLTVEAYDRAKKLSDAWDARIAAMTDNE